MRRVVIAIVTVAAGATSVAQTRSTAPPATPPAMTAETAFYYYIALYGAPEDVVDRYGRRFDSANYARAMADAAQRARYRDGLQAKISAQVRSLDFRRRFSVVGRAMLADYSRLNGSFRLLGAEPIGEHSYFSVAPSGRGSEIYPFIVRNAANWGALAWSVAMPEADARTFAQTHPDGRVTLRITYSVTKGKKDDPYTVYFVPFIHTIEVFDGDTLTKRLGILQ